MEKFRNGEMYWGGCDERRESYRGWVFLKLEEYGRRGKNVGFLTQIQPLCRDSRHAFKIFYNLPCVCRDMDNSCRSMLDAGRLLGIWACHDMGDPCCNMLLSGFWMMLLMPRHAALCFFSDVVLMPQDNKVPRHDTYFLPLYNFLFLSFPLHALVILKMQKILELCLAW